ncbi:MAG: hypothetical protein AB1779_09820 [Candidatus Thermoplasmatota archaeon]
MRKTGLSYVKMKIYNKEQSKFEEINLLVDSGSVYTWIYENTLKNLGIVPIGSRVFKTIEGRDIKRRIGEAVLEYEGEKRTNVVVFGNKNDAEVLGVVALENFGLEMDPITKKLKKAETLFAI